MPMPVTQATDILLVASSLHIKKIHAKNGKSVVSVRLAANSNAFSPGTSMAVRAERTEGRGCEGTRSPGTGRAVRECGGPGREGRKGSRAQGGTGRGGAWEASGQCQYNRLLVVCVDVCGCWALSVSGRKGCVAASYGQSGSACSPRLLRQAGPGPGMHSRAL